MPAGSEARSKAAGRPTGANKLLSRQLLKFESGGSSLVVLYDR